MQLIFNAEWRKVTSAMFPDTDNVEPHARTVLYYPQTHLLALGDVRIAKETCSKMAFSRHILTFNRK